jgi:hypothetical protein
VRCKFYENGRVATGPETLRLLPHFAEREAEEYSTGAGSRSGRDTTHSRQGSNENPPLNQRMVSEASDSQTHLIEGERIKEVGAPETSSDMRPRMHESAIWVSEPCCPVLSIATRTSCPGC